MMTQGTVDDTKAKLGTDENDVTFSLRSSEVEALYKILTKKGKRHPMAITSQAFSNPEKSFAITELETIQFSSQLLVWAKCIHRSFCCERSPY